MGALRNLIVFSMFMTVLINMADYIHESDNLIPTKANALIVRPEFDFIRPIAKTCVIPIKLRQPRCRLVPTTRIVCDYYV